MLFEKGIDLEKEVKERSRGTLVGPSADLFDSKSKFSDLKSIDSCPSVESRDGNRIDIWKSNP